MDTNLTNRGTTHVINDATGDIEIKAAVAGKGWICTYLYLEVSQASDLTFKSGSTAISGIVAGATSGQAFHCNGEPFLRNKLLGESFVVNNSAGEIDGWAYMVETDQ